MTRATYLRLFAIMIVLGAVTSVVLLQFDWFGEAASEEAGPIDTLFDVMIVLSSFVFSIVMVMFGYAIWKYRAKPGDESDGEPIHGNTKLEIAWTVIPTVIVLFGAGYSWIILDDIEEPAPASEQMQVNVTAQQFKWTFEYPESQGVTARRAARAGRHASSTCTSPPSTSSTPSGCRSGASSATWCPRGSGGDEVDDEVGSRPTSRAPTTSSAPSCAESGTRRCGRSVGGRVAGGIRRVDRGAGEARRPPGEPGRGGSGERGVDRLRGSARCQWH